MRSGSSTNPKQEFEEACLMTNPRNQLRDYLSRLINRYLYIKSIDRQLKLIAKWKTPSRVEALNIGAYFFKLVTYSFSRTILIELCKLVSDKEEKSLVDWLEKAAEHAASIEPTRYNPSYSEGEREPIEPKEYRAIIDSQKAQLDGQKEIIDRIKNHRDKALAHSDTAYFNNPNALYEHYPLSTNDIDSLMDTVSEILREHHSCLFEADVHLEVVSGHNVDTVLRYTRAWHRARRDRDLINLGFTPRIYTQDD